MNNRRLFVSFAFEGHPVGLRASHRDGEFEVFFCRYRVGSLNLRAEAEQAA